MENIDTEYRSGLELKSIFISKSSYSRKEALPKKMGMNFTFDYKLTEISDKSFSITLIGYVYSNEKDIEANTEVVANFELISTSENYEQLKEWKVQSALAIMFPYLRSQFTLISSQSGIPLIIPTVNINAYLEERNKQ